MLRAADTIWKTDTGRQRRDNEDNAFVQAPLFVVADGMGGAQAGEVASKLAVEEFHEALPDEGSAEARLTDRIRAANRRIYDLSRTEHELDGMGTTLTAAYLDDDHLAVAHVGDSRAYIFRDGELARLTQDHSLVEELVRQGKLTEEQAAEHPQRSIITRALGIENDVEVDTRTYPMRAGDIVLLCSDGLTSMIGEEQIVHILGGEPSLERAADRLIGAANDAGGRDNITVVLFRLEEVGGSDGDVSDEPTMVGMEPPPGAAADADAAEPTTAGVAAPLRPVRARRPRRRDDRPAAPTARRARADHPEAGENPRPTHRAGLALAAPAPVRAVRQARGGVDRDRGGPVRRRRRGLSREPRVLLRRDQLGRHRDGVPRLPLHPAAGGQDVRAVLRLRGAGERDSHQPARAAVQPPAALAGRRHQSRAGRRTRPAQPMSARNRELFGLIPAALLVTAGFAGVFIQRENTLSNVSLTYGAIFLALCLAAHVFIRLTLPNADPYMFPLVALLASFGIVMVYRISSTDARQQAQWFVLGLILFVATIILFRDYRKLEQYRYLIVVVSLVLLVLPRLPGIGEQVNGAYLEIKVPGGLSFQPTEFSKIGLVIFLASYLRDTRQVMVMGARRVLGVTLPPLKHFGPVLVIWGVAMVSLFLLSDIGSSLMFYGGLLAVLYVATSRLSFVVIGLLAFAVGAWYLGTHISHVHARVEDWLHPFDPTLYHATGGSFQVANGIFAQSAGGLFGLGWGQIDPVAAPVPTDRHDLRGHHRRAGAVRRHRGARRLPAVHLPRLQDRDAGPRLVLDAARRRTVDGVRAAGVRDRGRGHAGDPPHRRHAAVHLLRRRVDRGQLRAAGAAAARLGSLTEAGVGGPVNTQIRNLFGVIMILFALLIVWTTRWTVIDATALNHNPLNSRTLITALKIKRGRILTANGQTLARSVKQKGTGFWTRTYPQGSLFAQAVGYSNLARGQSAGLEQYRLDDLKGPQTTLDSVFGPLGGNQNVGDDVYTNLDPKTQQLARQELAGRPGSVVALDPRTGAVLTMYSNPSYDDNHPSAPCSDACQLNRATQGRYPPGSTFKVVTATAAIDSGKYTPDSTINGDSPKTISGVPLNNDNNQSFGPITLTKALTYSVNTVFAQVAENVGRRTMTKYMKRFGFYALPPIDLPRNELAQSRPFNPNGRPYLPASPNEDIGRIGIGQGGLLVTPMQMAMVAAAVANSGKLMEAAP